MRKNAGTKWAQRRHFDPLQDGIVLMKMQDVICPSYATPLQRCQTFPSKHLRMKFLHPPLRPDPRPLDALLRAQQPEARRMAVKHQPQGILQRQLSGSAPFSFASSSKTRVLWTSLTVATVWVLYARPTRVFPSGEGSLRKLVMEQQVGFAV